MDVKKIQTLIDLAKKEGLSELKFENKEVKISLSIPYGGTPAVLPQVAAIPQNIQQKENVNSEKAKDSQFHSIKSPFVGTFYRSPSPNDPAFVEKGQKIQKGQVLCILEAMKIMNEIDADISGEIVEICVENESFVEYGQELFLIKP